MGGCAHNNDPNVDRELGGGLTSKLNATFTQAELNVFLKACVNDYHKVG